MLALPAIQTTPETLEAGELSLLAVVQGLTEFLPISSSGHLVLAGRFLGNSAESLALEVALHLGTLLAVVIAYRHSIRDVVRDALGGRPREALLVVLGTLPVVVVGLGLKDAIEAHVRDQRLVSIGLGVTAVFLIVGEWGRRRSAPRRSDPRPERPLDARAAILIGLAQALAILPGVSRSGATISIGMLLGLRPEAAARFSFLLSIPAVLGATVLTAKDVGGALGASPGPLLWAVALSAFVGWAALRVLIAFLGRGAFLWFAGYCALLGTGLLIWG